MTSSVLNSGLHFSSEPKEIWLIVFIFYMTLTLTSLVNILYSLPGWSLSSSDRGWFFPHFLRPPQTPFRGDFASYRLACIYTYIYGSLFFRKFAFRHYNLSVIFMPQPSFLCHSKNGQVKRNSQTSGYWGNSKDDMSKPDCYRETHSVLMSLF